MVVLPARSRKPKDKALVEQTVRLMYQRVYAKLRDRTFYSIDELNAAILMSLMALMILIRNDQLYKPPARPQIRRL